MLAITYILKIVYYFAFTILTYSYVKHNIKTVNGTKKIKKIVLLACLIILIGIYSIICGPEDKIGDRYNYELRFIDDRYLPIVKKGSLGLYYIECFLHLFTHKASILFFTIGSLYYIITIFAYKHYKEAIPLVVLLLGMSAYGLYGFYLFKQCIAIALVAISFGLYFQNKKKYSYLFVLLATMFHESAWIMIPIYIMLSINTKKAIYRIIMYASFLFIVVFYKQINSEIIKIFSFIPNISSQMKDYLDESGNMIIDYNFLTIFKGFPYYLITFHALVNKKVFKDKIDNYDKYLTLCIICCLLTVLSLYMYWMWRFAAFCYFPIFVFAANMYKNDTNHDRKAIYLFLLVSSLFALNLKLLIQYYFIYGGIV